MQEVLEKLLARGIAEGCFPGAVAACGDRERVLATACGGVLWENGPQVNRETRYDMASMTKIMGPTMLALQGLEQGDLTLYDTVGDFFPDTPEDKKGITVFQLMTHTSGMVTGMRLDQMLDDPARVLDAVFATPLKFLRGDAPHYSCIGYITLGKMLEKMYGGNLMELTRKRVFEPLGMRHTGYCPEGGNIAATEIDPATGKALVGVVHDENARFLGGISGNAGIFSDIADTVRFAQMLARMGDGYLSPATVKKAIHNYTQGKEFHRGLGFHLAGTPENFIGDLFPAGSFGHTGFTGTSLAIDPETGFYAVLLTNRVHPTRENTRHAPFRRRFHNALYAAYTRTCFRT